MKNTVRLNESQLRQIIAESVEKVLKENFWDDDFYYIGMDGFDLRANDVVSLNFMGYNDDSFETPEEALVTIKHMLSYPEGSSESDIRYANGIILLLSICNGDGTPVDNVIYMSPFDKEYFKAVHAQIPDKEIKFLQ